MVDIPLSRMYYFKTNQNGDLLFYRSDGRVPSVKEQDFIMASIRLTRKLENEKQVRKEKSS
jgi:hypothetical protein